MVTDTQTLHTNFASVGLFELESRWSRKQPLQCGGCWIGGETKAPHRANGMRNDMKSGKGDLAAERHLRATQGQPFLFPEDDPKITSLFSDIEQQLFSSSFGSRQKLIERELDWCRHEDYFGYGR